MRKAQKEQLLEILQTLYEAHQIIKKHNGTDLESVLRILSECQETVEQVYVFVEESEGADSHAANTLENYYKALYQVSADLPENISVQKAVKALNKSLAQAEMSIKEIQVRLEVVFFPYKASMWDALESVWKVAKADPNCDAYVVPIPYFEKNPDGTLGQLYYEGVELPEEIPIIDWRQYDVQTRRPDAIFIHNPYDAGNYVTTIHPDYYSQRLKQYTNMLVYIPYYVAADILPDEMCVTAGCINADRVIVQSEAVRQNYIGALYRTYKENHASIKRRDLEKKIVAMGSPKLEKAACSKRDEYKLPNEWKLLIEKEDGTQKRVVFYNTSLTTFLQWDEKYLEKLRSVLEIFKNQQDIVLWWRPHPLSEATIKSLRHELLWEYEEIITSYKQEGWGIYDDTADLHRAIAWSDAYYGDKSSVTMLFNAAKKPVMIQSIEKEFIVFENFIHANGDYWFTSIQKNGLFKLNVQTDEAEFIGFFPKEKDYKRLFMSITQYKNKLIFTPFSANAVAIYCMDSCEFISIPLKEPQMRDEVVTYCIERKFAACAVYGEHAFLFPCTYPAVIKLNLETYEVEYLYGPIKTLASMVKQKQSYYFRQGQENGKTVQLWCVAAGALVEFNMENCRFKSLYELNSNKKYVAAKYDGLNYWLLPSEENAELLKLSGDCSQVTPVTLPDGVVAGNIPFLHAVMLEDYMWLLPGTANDTIKINTKKNDAEIVYGLNVDDIEPYKKDVNTWKFLFSVRIEDIVYAYENCSQKLISYNLSTNSIKKAQIETNNNSSVDDRLFFDVLDAQYANSERETELYIYESNRISVSSYLKVIQKQACHLYEALDTAQKRIVRKDGIPESGSVGLNIYEYIMRNI